MNATMKTAWDRAMSILKPTERELSHGLEIHASSIVFDAYGFAP